jgi:hypothetical protein
MRLTWSGQNARGGGAYIYHYMLSLVNTRPCIPSRPASCCHIVLRVICVGDWGEGGGVVSAGTRGSRLIG